MCEWIDYATLDADCTWHLRECFHKRYFSAGQPPPPLIALLPPLFVELGLEAFA